MNKKCKIGARVLAILTIACMIFVSVPPMQASAAIADKTYVNSMDIGNSAGDSVTITKVAPYILNVQCTHSMEYDGMDVRAYKNGTNTYSLKPQYIRYGLGAGESWGEDFDFSSLSNGTHKLVVYKKDGDNYKPYVDRIAIQKTSSGINIIDYSGIRIQNDNVRKSGSSAEKYKNTSMQDFKYMLFNKEGSTSSSTRRTINASTESAYYKKIADSIVSAEDTDYTKLRKIYAYVAEKLYYDNYKTKAPYDDPYYNLRHINKLDKASGYNWSSGKVAAQCDGYAGLYIALVRSQGIPARMVSGNLLSSSGESWENEASGKGIKRTTHCWVQAYVDDRWIEIDPCRATLSKRNSDGTWTKERQINYMFFDMTDMQMAHTHCSVGFEGDLAATSAAKSQTITTGAASYSKVIGNKAFNLNAKAKTGLSYKSSNTKVATVSTKGLVTLKGTGKATITITAKASSSYKAATKKVTVTVKPKQVTGLKLTKAKKSFTAKWSKATGASGYQVAYTTDKNFKKNIKYTTTTSLKKTVSKLTAKKTYYVKVRAYKTYSGSKIYGSYSVKKSIKTK